MGVGPRRMFGRRLPLPNPFFPGIFASPLLEIPHHAILLLAFLALATCNLSSLLLLTSFGSFVHVLFLFCGFFAICIHKCILTICPSTATVYTLPFCCGISPRQLGNAPVRV